ncbi:hypothetical protein NECAME_14839 [Necator americanus]|uniref:Uncharacterized protein n=1 Tax=Necator americanus TaxID=51031 RepID=W2SND3_NECAM|nr:hypothetical protein NECAME_14839 [Necator americanus]ETN70346.1 hypothetical protein NECAME_14839 [Necator americanus]
MLTFSGQFSASLNFIAAVMDFMNMDQMRVRNVLLIQRYTESMFFVANLATCIERSVAVLAIALSVRVCRSCFRRETEVISLQDK